MNIVRNDWWTTPVWQAHTDFDRDFNQQLLYEVELFYSGNNISGFKNNVWNAEGEAIAKLKQTTIDIVTEATNEFIQAPYNDLQLQHSRGWINQNRPGDSVAAHGHGSPWIAMTYYIDVPEKGGDLLLVDPRGGVAWDDTTEAISGVKTKRIKPNTGDLVFFPGFLVHNVEENKSNRTRISLSSNMYLTDKS